MTIMLLRAVLIGLLLASFVLTLAACGAKDIPPCTPAPGSSVDPCEPDVQLPRMGGRAEASLT